MNELLYICLNGTSNTGQSIKLYYIVGYNINNWNWTKKTKTEHIM